MDRAEIITGLTGMLTLSCSTCAEENVVKAALGLLRVPASAEIEAAREWLRAVCGPGGPISGHPTATVDRALDALAREPGMEAVDRSNLDWAAKTIPRLDARIAALEINLARVREALDNAAKSLEWIARNGIDDEDPSSLKAYTRNRAAVARAALTDEATK